MSRPDDHGDITALDADALSTAIHARRVSCREVMSAYLERIHRLNPRLNAIVNLAPGDALLCQAADKRVAELAQGRSRGWLHGVPQAIKDASPVTGFPNTLGSPLLANTMPARDSVMAARMKAAGCIVVGKTNSPEFGLGSHTFNELFGATPNAVGSDGERRRQQRRRRSGAGAAPAAGGRRFRLHGFAAQPGSLGQHLRPAPEPGPRAVLAGGRHLGQPARHRRADGAHGARSRQTAVDPGRTRPVLLSIAQGSQSFDTAADPATLRGLRIGWLGDLGGHLAMLGLLDVAEAALARFAAAGSQVEPIALGFDADRLWRAWLVWRRAVGARIGALIDRPGARERIKPEALWEYDQGAALSFHDFMRASEVRTAFHARMLELFERFDVLALPVTQVWPFPIGQRWPAAHRWLRNGHLPPLDGVDDLRHLRRCAGHQRPGRLSCQRALARRTAADREAAGRCGAASRGGGLRIADRRPAVAATNAASRLIRVRRGQGLLPDVVIEAIADATGGGVRLGGSLPELCTRPFRKRASPSRSASISVSTSSSACGSASA